MSEPMDDVFNWLILSPNNKKDQLDMTTRELVTPTSDHIYDLYNRTDQEALRYGERTWGINLVWGDPDKVNNIRFERQSGDGSALASGELVAINVRGGKYLKYQKRDVGINLAWSDRPVFEWKLSVSAPNVTIQTVVPAALFNTVENDFLFYDPREYGINLKWLRDKGKFNKPWYDKVVEIIRDNVKINVPLTVG